MSERIDTILPLPQSNQKMPLSHNTDEIPPLEYVNDTSLETADAAKSAEIVESATRNTIYAPPALGEISEMTVEIPLEALDVVDAIEENEAEPGDEVDICSHFSGNSQSSNAKKVLYTKLKDLKWPIKWDGWCGWDCHPFDGIPIPIVRRDPLGNPDKVVISDAQSWFCSPNCMKAYLMWLGTAHAYETLSQMKVVLRNFLGIDQEYAAALPREMLYCFHPHGPQFGLSITDFRKGHLLKQIFVKPAPLIINTMLFQEYDSVTQQKLKHKKAVQMKQMNQMNQTSQSTGSQGTPLSAACAIGAISSSSFLPTQTNETHFAESNQLSFIPIPIPQSTPITSPFDAFYLVNRLNNGPPPAQTNPTGRPKRSRAKQTSVDPSVPPPKPKRSNSRPSNRAKKTQPSQSPPTITSLTQS